MLGYCKLEILGAALCATVLLAGCTDDTQADRPPDSGAPEEGVADTSGTSDPMAISYLALGDSYTIGTGLPDPNDAFPYQLATRLDAEAGLEVAPPLIIAQNGWTTANLQNGIAQATTDSTYQLVSLLIGVNNQFQGRPIEEYKMQFTALLETALSFAGGDTAGVFVLSIPDYSVTPFGQNMNPEAIAEGVDAFNAANESISENLGVSYFHITDISRELGSSAGALAPDNLHPSGTQYAAWIDSFYEHVKEKIHE